MGLFSTSLILCVGLLCSVSLGQEPATQASPDFSREVLPILETHCFECHGRHTQKAGLRLDQRAAALAGSSFGEDPVLVAGDREASLLWEMIALVGEDERMPPSEKPGLSAEQIDVLGRWIDAGVPWPDDGEAASWPVKHWAYQRPRSSTPPPLGSFPERVQGWPRNEVDHFLLDSMLTAELTPQLEAAPGTLLRRASLDLIGLPPSVEDLDAFLADAAPDAWSKALTRLMDSPHFGEQQAQRWLDLARYADSNGYEKDESRSIWPFRDWVIEAYNQDLGFDRFTIEQLAGDLLPEPTPANLIATGFHRNTMVNNEGGTDAEEFRVAAVQDRTDTTATVWLGSTVGCAQCHNHKYDPFTQRDYYQLYAFFDQTADGGKSTMPTMPVETPRILAERQAALSELERLQESFPQEAASEFVWVAESHPESTQQEGDWAATTEGEPFPVRWRDGDGFNQFHFEGASAPLTLMPGDRFFVQVYLDPEVQTKELFLQFHVAGGNWEHRAFLGEDLHPWGTPETGSRRRIGDLPEAGSWQRIEIDPAQCDLPVGTRVDGMAFGQFDGRVAWGPAGLLTRNPDPTAALPEALQAQLERMHRPATTMVMRTVDSPRTTHLLEKGNFLSPGYAVEAAIPAVLRGRRRSPLKDRLELAQWLVEPRNPLTARVEVNRVWQQIFGIGLVATVDDFGSQGEAPSHPELLDWLALEFVRNGWSRKWLLRTLMESATYRQAATRSAEARESDPNNRLLAHFPRLRLSGENLRDMHLTVSGLLVPEIGGPSVFPPQPAGIDAGTYAGDRWRTDSGPDRYRRGLYTFWRRTSPYPSFVLFDATSRELLCARRDRSNTPLQALALLNDPAFAETTRAFGKQLESLKLKDDDARIAYGFRACTGRRPDLEELTILMNLKNQSGWESVARVLLNLDDTLNRG
ncbi:MAG: hypothetical protein ACI9X4_001130 [Glaciecola sp.]|jgi:hypothetical protein